MVIPAWFVCHFYLLYIRSRIWETGPDCHWREGRSTGWSRCWESATSKENRTYPLKAVELVQINIRTIMGLIGRIIRRATSSNSNNWDSLKQTRILKDWNIKINFNLGYTKFTWNWWSWYTSKLVGIFAKGNSLPIKMASYISPMSGVDGTYSIFGFLTAS